MNPVSTVATSTTPSAPGLPERHTVEPRLKWRLEAIYASTEAWEDDFARVQAWLGDLKTYRGRLDESADTLLAAFKARDRMLEVAGRLAVFAQMRRDEDTRNAFHQGLAERISKLATAIGESLSFMAPEILAIDPARLDGFVASHDELALYRHHIDEFVRMRAHTLSGRDEELVAMTAELARGPQTIFSMLNDADLKFPTIQDEDGRPLEVTKGRYYKLMESPDRRVRRDAFEAFFTTYGQFRNTWAASLQAAVKRNIFYARVRRYESALHAALYPNHIPVPVFENLVAAVNANLEPLHRYCALRKRVLRYDELHPYDMATPLVPEVRMHFTYDEAVALVRTALAPMGFEYTTVLGRGFEEGWIDVVETAGKRSGAYSSGTYGTQPYILLNFEGTLSSVFTLAHELGHSLHSHYSQHAQPFVYADYPIFLAEVASTASESLLVDHLLKTTSDPRRRLYLLNHWIDQIRGTFYTQVMFAEFEWEIHRRAEAGEPLTHESLSALFGELYGRYHGPALVNDELHFCGWSRIPHFYYNFYVYQYATGYAAASALSQKILREGDRALEAYVGFLKSGCSDYPIDILRQAGVDMATPAPIEDTIRLFSRLLDDMEALLARVHPA
jgi:oligoendopeptidase F